MDEQHVQPLLTQNKLVPQAVPIKVTPLYNQRSFFQRKSILPAIFLTVLLLGGIGVGLSFMGTPQDVRSKATNNGPALAINPRTKSLDVGKTISLGITLNTNDDTVSAVELHLTYDKTAIQITGFTVGTMLPVVLKPATFANGTIDAVLGVQPTTPFKGSGILATITAKILAPKTSIIAFTNAAQVAALGKTINALTSKAGITITGVLTNTTTTPTPTSIFTPTPTHTLNVIATQTPTYIPKITNSPTPFPSQEISLPIITNRTSKTSPDIVVEDYSPFSTTQKQVQKTGIFNKIYTLILEFFRKLF